MSAHIFTVEMDECSHVYSGNGSVLTCLQWKRMNGHIFAVETDECWHVYNGNG